MKKRPINYLYEIIKNMKTKLYIAFFIATTIFISTTNAQKILNDGTIVYNISIESAKGEKQIPGALNGAVLTLSLTKDKSSMQQVSTIGAETNVYDAKAGKGFILKEYSAQKLMITTNADNWAQKNQVNRGLKFSTQDGTTNIAGYNCKKATATAVDGKTYIVFYDPTIELANKTYNNAFPQLNGLPVQYELQSGNLIFKYTLSKYNTDVVMPNKFDAPKAGFRTMTYEENQQLKKGE
jgi:GLPGLI family protein